MAPSRRAVLAGSGLGLTALFGGLVGWDGWEPGSSPYDWPMARYDAAGTAHHPDASGPTSEPTVRWETDTDPGFSPQSERPFSPIRLGSTLYIAGSGFSALDADNGDIRFQFEGTHDTAPARARAGQYETDTIVTGTEQALVGYNASGGLGNSTVGGQRWRVPRSGGNRERTDATELRLVPRPVPAPPVSADGVVYVIARTARQFELVAIEPDTGAIRWRFDAPEAGALGTLYRPAICDGTIYVVTFRGRLTALSTDGPTELWQFQVETELSARSPTATASGVVIPHGSGIVSLTPDGDLRWQRTLEPESATTAAVASSTIVFVHGKTLYALEADTGETLWTATEFTTDPVIADGVVYAVDGATLVGLRLDTGDRLFEFELDRSRQFLSPPVVGDGRLYCNTRRTTIALEEP